MLDANLHQPHRPIRSTSRSREQARSRSPLTPFRDHPSTIINGYSQPGSQAEHLAQGDNAVIEIQIDGSQVPEADGLAIAGGGNTVKGLDITDFTNGIHLTGAVRT